MKSLPPHPNKIYLLSDARCGSTWLAKTFCSILDYDVLESNYRYRELLNPRYRKIYSNDCLWDEPFCEEYLNKYPSSPNFWRGVEHSLINSQRIVLKDHLSHSENYMRNTGYMLKKSPWDRGVYDSFTKIKLIRKNIWERALSVQIALHTNIWGLSKPHQIEIYKQRHPYITLNPIDLECMLDDEADKIWNLINYHPTDFEYTLYYENLLEDNGTFLKEIFPLYDPQKTVLSVKLPNKFDLITNSDELYSVFNTWKDKVNNDSNTPYSIDEKDHIRIKT